MMFQWCRPYFSGLSDYNSLMISHGFPLISRFLLVSHDTHFFFHLSNSLHFFQWYPIKQPIIYVQFPLKSHLPDVSFVLPLFSQSFAHHPPIVLHGMPPNFPRDFPGLKSSVFSPRDAALAEVQGDEERFLHFGVEQVGSRNHQNNIESVYAPIECNTTHYVTCIQKKDGTTHYVCMYICMYVYIRWCDTQNTCTNILYIHIHSYCEWSCTSW